MRGSTAGSVVPILLGERYRHRPVRVVQLITLAMEWLPASAGCPLDDTRAAQGYTMSRYRWHQKLVTRT